MFDRFRSRLRERPLLLALQQHFLDRRIRRGNFVEVRSFVEDLSAEKRRKLTEDSHFMAIAIAKKKPEIIRFLVEECFADVEKPLDMDDEQFSQEFCMPLFFAVETSTTEAAIELMRLGANVNAVSTHDRLTALHAACMKHNLPLIRELIQHGADITMKSIYGDTALDYALENVDVCRVLIESGVDVNASHNFGNTVLHSATRKNNPEVVELLIRNGADIFKKNNRGDDALTVACTSSATDSLTALINHLPEDNFKCQILIRSHQLLGACYLNYKNQSDDGNGVEKALIEWEAAVRLRDEMRHINAEEDDVVRKPNAAYDNAVEVDSISKLDEIRQDEDMIYMQGLLLMEKILGSTHHKTFLSVLHLADVFTEHDDYERGLRLLRHSFKLSCDGKLIFPDIIYYTYGLKCVCIHYWSLFFLSKINLRVNFKDVYEFLETVTLEARRLSPPTLGDKTVSSFQDEENANFMLIVLFLIRLFFLVTKNEAQEFEFKKLVNQFIRLNTKSLGGRTFLMFAICPDDKEDSVLCHLEVDVIKLLLECGADAAETDDDGNSVLHLLAKSVRSSLETTGIVPKKEVKRKVAEMLLAFGAHFDARNIDRLSAHEYLQCLGLNFSNCMTLQCLAAQVIRLHRIPCAGILPKSLIDFVEMH